MPLPTEASTSASASAEASPQPTFASLGVSAPLCAACDSLSFKHPTPIQRETLPYALEGRDIIGLAQTGSGKTAAFAIPVLQALWEDPRGLFAVVLAPTRELAYQIAEQFQALGSGIGVRVATIVGGMDMMAQAVALAKKPHIIVATPGRLNDHLENTKGFSLRSVRYLIMDEADRLLDLDFGPIIDKILKVLPREERKTYLFSATMTTKVAKLQRASLRDPVKVEVSSKYETVSTLLQFYLLVPAKHKDLYLVHLLSTMQGSSIILFTRTIHDSARLALMLSHLAFPSTPIHGQLSQSSRLAALNVFKSGKKKILVATDVASRGLDIPHVDVVLNYDVPSSSKDYIHRVGRTARAGKGGKSITFVTQYDVEVYQRIEGVLGRKLDEWQVFPSAGGGSKERGKEEVFLLSEKVGEAQRLAAREIKEFGFGGRAGAKKGKRRREEDGGSKDDMDRDDDQYEAGVGAYKKYANKKAKNWR